MRQAATLMATAAVGFMIAGFPGVLASIATIAFGPWVVNRVRARRALGHIGTDLCLILELAARSIRSGHALSRSLEEAASMVGGDGGMLIDELLDDARSGQLRLAVTEWERRHGHAAVTVAAAALGLAADGEGSASRALEAGATMLRERDVVAREAAAWAAQARASASLLVAAPVVLAGVAMAIDPTSTLRMLSHPGSAASVAMGVALECAGAAWMRRLIRSSVGSQ